MQSAEPILSLRGIGKTFYGNRVLADVSFDVAAGEIVGLVGENGAGKSTIVKVLTGIYQPDSGTIEVDGTPARFADAQARYDSRLSQAEAEAKTGPRATAGSAPP